MEEKEQSNIRSEEVQEILGTPPRWIVQWGTTAIVLGVILLGLMAYLIKYSDIVYGPVSIGTESDPIEITMEKGGRIGQLLVNSKDRIEEGQLLYILDNDVDYDTFLQLESVVSEWNNYGLQDFLDTYPGPSDGLGPLSNLYENFGESLSRLRNTPRSQITESSVGPNSIIAKEIRDKQNQFNKVTGDLEKVEEAYKRVKREREVAQKAYTDASDKSVESPARKKLNIASDLEAKTRQKRNQLASKQGLLRTQIKRLQERSNVPPKVVDAPPNYNLTEVQRTLDQLKKGIDEWKSQSVVLAPYGGTVIFPAKPKPVDQPYRSGETILSIIPDEGEQLIGKVRVAPSELRTIELNDPVIINLDIVDPDKDGVIEAVVLDKSGAQNEDKTYTIYISLPYGLTTDQGREIEYNNRLFGQAEIITKEKRFSTRIMDEIKAIFR